MSLIKLFSFEIRGDDRGSLVALEGGGTIPFDIQRVYYIFGTKAGVSRGFHAHRRLSQIMICVCGSCRIVLDDGRQREEIVLDSPMTGLEINDLMWREMHDFSADCVLMVLADRHYDETDYIRDYDEFIREVTGS